MSGERQLACRFSLSPMCDGFVDVILGAIGKVGATAIRQHTDKLSTVYRGSQDGVEDAVEACFCHAFREGVHMTMEAAFSNLGEGEDLPDATGRPNAPALAAIHFPAVGKLSLYPLEGGSFDSWIGRLAERARVADVYRERSFDGVILEGDVQDIFACVHEVNTVCLEELGQYVLAFTLSVNSPTVE